MLARRGHLPWRVAKSVSLLEAGYCDGGGPDARRADFNRAGADGTPPAVLGRRADFEAPEYRAIRYRTTILSWLLSQPTFVCYAGKTGFSYGNGCAKVPL